MNMSLWVSWHRWIHMWETSRESLYKFVSASPAISRVSGSSWKVCEKGDKWQYSCCIGRCCFQDLFKIAHSIFALLTSSFFFKYLVEVQVEQPYNSTDTVITWKNSCFILSASLDFHIVGNPSIAVHIFYVMLTSLSVDEILLSRYVKWSTNFRDLTSCLKHMNSVSSEFI